MENKKFFIAGIQRTGTTYIRTMLNSHHDIRCIGESFHPSKQGCEYYYRFREQSFRNRIMHIVLRKKIIYEYFEYIYNQKNYHAVGFKIMLNQSNKFPEVKKYLKEKSIKGIIVIRKNILKTYISRITARKRKLFHSHDKVATEKIFLEPSLVLSRLNHLERSNQAVLKTFQSLNHLLITYEDFVINKNNLHAQMLDYIGVDSTIPLSSPLKKLNPDSLQEIVMNYDQLSSRLIKSPYAYCLR
jgi:LPS sulfotransferase NodH